MLQIQVHWLFCLLFTQVYIEVFCSRFNFFQFHNFYLVYFSYFLFTDIVHISTERNIILIVLFSSRTITSICFFFEDIDFIKWRIGTCWWWGWMHVIPALGKQRQVDLYEFMVSPVYKESSRTGQLHIETMSRKPPQMNKQINKHKVLTLHKYPMISWNIISLSQGHKIHLK